MSGSLSNKRHGAALPTLNDADRLIAARDRLLLTLGPPSAVARLPTDESPKVPVTVLSGFLGAGKTTLLCRLLESTDKTVIAVVNDIGAINVDAARVRTRSAETIELDNGCACCVLGSDLHDTLNSLVARPRRPDAIVIEASGLADPVGIAQTVAQVSGASLDGVVTLVDALAYSERTLNAAAQALFDRQLDAAHLVMLTKTADTHEPRAVRDSLAVRAPGRPVFSLEDPGSLDLVFGATTLGARPAPQSREHQTDDFQIETLRFAHALPAEELTALLEGMPRDIFRMKGVVLVGGRPDRDADRWNSLQSVGRRWRLDACAKPAEGGHLVLIGAAEDPSRTSQDREVRPKEPITRASAVQEFSMALRRLGGKT